MASTTNGHTNGHTNGTSDEKIVLYTNHGCPFAHRAHIVLKELGLQYEEVIIDLDTPREPWYLKINPVCTHSSLPFLAIKVPPISQQPV